jgi:hypothetical protein
MVTATTQVGIPTRHKDGWQVPSSKGDQQYLVQQHRLGWSCQCADHAYRGRHGRLCKHIRRVIALLLSEEEEGMTA